ncbi:POK18 protein, partial [Alopecoenas beccarii]|nr:POK18 protein [Alopecoenas beccarii]
AQKLLGTINWLRPYLGLISSQLAPLFETLKADPDLTSPWQLSTAAKAALEQVEWALSHRQVYRIDVQTPVTLFVIIAELHPTGILGQWNSDWPNPLHVL